MKSTELLLLLKDISNTIIDNSEMLNDLDRAIGDADHGINMRRGFLLVLEDLDNLTDKDIGTIFNKVAMTLLSKVGGASGPLYATAFMKFAQVCKGRDEIDSNLYTEMIGSAIDGMKMRGKSDAGCKTILDSMIPYYKTLETEIKKTNVFKELSPLALKSSEEGVEYTKTIIATKGRASYLGERSIGHADPGAMSSYLIFKAIDDFIK